MAGGQDRKTTGDEGMVRRANRTKLEPGVYLVVGNLHGTSSRWLYNEQPRPGTSTKHGPAQPRRLAGFCRRPRNEAVAW